MKVYKVQLFRWNLENKDEYRDYAIKHNIVAFGWPAKESVSSVDEYYDKGPNWFKKDYLKKQGIDLDPYTNLKSWKKAKECLNSDTGTFIWTGGKGTQEFYLGVLKGKTELPSKQNWQCDDEKIKRGEVGILRLCKWHKIDFNYVPGDIATYIRADGTVRLIAREEGNADYVKYCQFLYENYKDLEMAFKSNKLKDLDFYKLCHPDDLEDLVGLYLQKNGYYIFPSTNKHGTADYEFELIKQDGTEQAVIQCKHRGEINIEKLKTYKKNIYLLNINDQISLDNPKKWDDNGDMGWKATYRDDENKPHNIFVFDANKLKGWAGTDANTKILPQRIQNFLKISK